MSTLLIDELYNGVVFEQNFKINRNTNLAHIRPWIYKQGTLQNGVFQCQVLDGVTVLATSTIDYTDINTAITGTYAHGFLRFDFDSLALRIPEGQTEKEYTVKFEMTSHITNTSNFISIVRRWELKSYNTYGDVVGNEAVNDAIEPAGLELFEYVYL